MSRSGSLLSIVSLALLASGAWASPNAVVITQKAAENQIKNLLNPILDKYCHDDCKLMSVLVAVDVATPDQVAPGFDEIESKSNQDLAPSAATIRLCMNEERAQDKVQIIGAPTAVPRHDGLSCQGGYTDGPFSDAHGLEGKSRATTRACDEAIW